MGGRIIRREGIWGGGCGVQQPQVPFLLDRPYRLVLWCYCTCWGICWSCVILEHIFAVWSNCVIWGFRYFVWLQYVVGDRLPFGVVVLMHLLKWLESCVMLECIFAVWSDCAVFGFRLVTVRNRWLGNRRT